MRRLFVLLLTAAAGGCSTYSSYVCPDPIGPIVRQDCDDYRVRYENLQAKLQISIGSFSIGGEVGEQKLRDPSELVQVMMQRMLALCHDYNACRIDNAEYRRRRDEADRVFTAVMAVLEQLKDPNLDQAGRARLSARLLAILERRPAETSTPSAPPGQPRRRRNPFRNVFGFWTGSRFAAPRPELPAPHVPHLLEVHQRVSGRKLAGLSIWLWGPVQADDFLLLDGDIRCPVRPRPDGQFGVADCRAEFGERRRFAASYLPGATSRQVAMGTIDVSDRSHRPRAWLAFQPDPVDLEPVEAERPWLLLELPAESRTQVSARCRHDGRPVEMEGSSVLKGTSQWQVKLAGGLHRFALPLPVQLPHPTGKTAGAGPLAGAWQCRVSLDGLPRYRVRFQVGADGRPRAISGGRRAPARPWWPVRLAALPGQL